MPWAAETAQRVKALATMPEDLSSALGLTQWKERTNSHELSADLHTLVGHILCSSLIELYTQKIKKGIVREE